jgi:acetyl esterase/lipase
MRVHHRTWGALAAAIILAALPGCGLLQDLLYGDLSPDQSNLRYGGGSRNVLDLWQAEGAGPRPLLVHFHGGAFLAGDKRDMDPELLRACLDNGISVAAPNYTYASTAPFPRQMEDGARAIQFLRHHAATYNIDPDRIASFGVSAGGGIALWLAVQDDLANPASSDPVARASTRVAVVGGFESQSSYDPRFYREFIRGRAYEHPALPTFFGITPQQYDSAAAQAKFEAASALNFATADDPPAWLYYIDDADPLPDGPNQFGATLYYPDFGKPLDGYPPVEQGIHHPVFGQALSFLMDPLGVEVVLRARFQYQALGSSDPDRAAIDEFVGWLRARLGA